MKRAFDIAAAACALIVLAPVLAVIAVIVRLETPGPAIHWSRRAGRNGALFAMPKFRTMRIETPDVATHMLENPAQWVTPAGRVLRKTSLDELPQLWPILIGAMSFVGPRPALHNQQDLIALRAEAGVDRLRPGLTGWAQVKGRDGLSIEEKVALDRDYLARRSFVFDMKILLMTAAAVFRSDGVAH